MKKALTIFFCTILMISCSYNENNEKKTNYTVYWQDRNLCIVMPHPTMGIITPGQISWSGVELSDVMADIYNELQKTSLV